MMKIITERVYTFTAIAERETVRERFQIIHRDDLDASTVAWRRSKYDINKSEIRLGSATSTSRRSGREV